MHQDQHFLLLNRCKAAHTEPHSEVSMNMWHTSAKENVIQANSKSKHE